MKQDTIALALLSALLVTPAAAQNDDAKAELVRLKPKRFSHRSRSNTPWSTRPAAGWTSRPGCSPSTSRNGAIIGSSSTTAPAAPAWSATLSSPPRRSPTATRSACIANLVWGDAMLRAQGRWTLHRPGADRLSEYRCARPGFDRPRGRTRTCRSSRLVQAAKDKPGTIRVATVPGSMWDYLIEQVEANTGAKVPARAVPGRRGRHQCAGRRKRRHRARILLRIPRPRRRRQGAAYRRGGLGAPEFPERHSRR